ncbi:hypothetical protein BDZ91DRAFT_768788 [Kalaharituber pfeilii]|nr:hypothetical protein BDZ91DRAFT_768788 [Kalaharituber pfeilii]
MTKLPPAIFLIIPHPSPLRRLRGPLTASHPTAASTVQQKSRRKEAEKQRKNKKQQPSGRQKKTQEPKARNSSMSDQAKSTPLPLLLQAFTNAPPFCLHAAKEPIEQTNSETSSKIGSEKQTSNPSTFFNELYHWSKVLFAGAGVWLAFSISAYVFGFGFAVTVA